MTFFFFIYLFVHKALLFLFKHIHKHGSVSSQLFYIDKKEISIYLFLFHFFPSCYRLLWGEVKEPSKKVKLNRTKERRKKRERSICHTKKDEATKETEKTLSFIDKSKRSKKTSGQAWRTFTDNTAWTFTPEIHSIQRR